MEEDFETVTASCPVPIVMAGVNKLPELEALTMADKCVLFREDLALKGLQEGLVCLTKDHEQLRRGRGIGRRPDPPRRAVISGRAAFQARTKASLT